ncbi:MAG: hypothetical protein ACLFR7_06365, partial [Opitutales bacterium]
ADQAEIQRLHQVFEEAVAKLETLRSERDRLHAELAAAERRSEESGRVWEADQAEIQRLQSQLAERDGRLSQLEAEVQPLREGPWAAARAARRRAREG